jgi:hypothetical protein
MKPASNALIEHVETPAAIVPVSESAAIFQIIERAARDPNVDITKMERLMEMHERMQANRAKAAYASALAEMQPRLPIIEENGKIVVKDKVTKEVIQSTSYALWEDINEAIKPILAEHGFAITFRNGLAPDGKVMVTAILSHREGHQEETTMVLPHDSTGSKNAVQAVGSSTQYGKRYTASALLNITSRGEDDDAQATGEPPIKEPVSAPAKSSASLKRKDENGQDAWDRLIGALRHDLTDCTSTMRLSQLRADYRAKARDERWPRAWLDALGNEFDTFEDTLKASGAE